MSDWNDFHVAVAGASAALTGLIFVGVSISLTKILSIRGLPERALLSLVLLLNVLVLSVLGLVPGLGTPALGLWMLSISSATWLIVLLLDIRNFKNKSGRYKALYVLNILVDQIATVFFVVAGIGIVAGAAAGMYWIVPAVLLSIIKAVIDSWVLLVEINR